MFKHILAPTDGSPLSATGLSAAVELARVTGARLTFITCSMPLDRLVLLPPSARQRGDYDDAMEAAAVTSLAVGHRIASTADVPAESLHLPSAQPWRTIIDTASERGCDVIVMASHGRGGVSGLLGSETRKVLAHTNLPVLVVR